MKKSIFAMFMIALVLLCAGCSGEIRNAEWPTGSTEQELSEEESRMNDISEEQAEMNTAKTDEEAVLAAFEKMQQAMIDKDVETMSALVTADKTFPHMSGKTQTKEEFFGEIAYGTLNYYKYRIENPVVKIDGDTATLTADTTLTARVYGMSGSWTLHTVAHYFKINGEWIQCN